METQNIKFNLTPPLPKFRLHLLLFVVVIHAMCDLLSYVFKKVGAWADKMHVKGGGTELTEFSLKDMGDLSKMMKKENMSFFRVLKGFAVVMVFLCEFLMPYVIFNKTSMVMRTNFENQKHSYPPFTLVTMRPLKDPRDFLKSRKELEFLMQKEDMAEQAHSLDILNFFNSLSDLEDDSKEAVQKRLDEHLDKNRKAEEEMSVKGVDAYNLSSFNRFVVFTLSKAALHGIYVAVHAFLSPHNHNAFVNSFRKKR